MKPYYEANGITLSHGDCREILPELSGIDLVLTDPPYGTGEFSGGYGRAQNYGGMGRKIANDENLDVTLEVLNMIAARIDNGFIVSFCAPRKMKEMLTLNARFYGELIWDKGTPGLGYTMRYLHESALVWRIGEPALPDEPLFSVIRVNVEHHNAHLRHPHEKPILFWANAFRLPGALTVDPFAGTGSMLLAAKCLERRAMGIEIEERYCEIAARRLENTNPLFSAPLEDRDTMRLFSSEEL